MLVAGFLNVFDGLSYPWANAITDAAFNNGPAGEVVFACPSGNCTWPLFTSLGVCSNYRDVSAYVQAHTDCQTSSGFSTHRKFLKRSAPSSNREVTTCNYRMPPLRNGNVTITKDTITENGNQSLTVKFTSSRPKSNVPLFSTFTVYDGKADGKLENFALVQRTPEKLVSVHQTPFGLDDGMSIPSKTSLLGLLRTNPDNVVAEAAHLCALSLCANRLNATVDRGILSSEVVATSYSEMSWIPSTSLSSYTFFSGNETFNDTVDRNESDAVPLEYMLNHGLRIILQGNVTGSTSGGVPDPLRPKATSQLMFAFNNSTDAPATMARVAKAIINYMQVMSNETILGQTASIEPFVQVRWAWLALPASLIAAGIVTLILAVTKTKRHNLRVWKTAEMALLFHGLDPPIPQVASINIASEMESWSKDVKARLVQGSGDCITLRRSIT